MTTVKIRFPAPSAFMVDLRERIDAYFSARHIEKTANAAMVSKSIFWLGLTAALFVINIVELVPFPISLAISAANGFAVACVGFNVGHDAIHGSYSQRPWINRVLSWSFDLMGASSSTWAIYHNVIHHTYTNICGVDQDLEPGPTLRFHPSATPATKVQRFQFLYAWVLYGLIGFIWVFWKDFRQAAVPHPVSGVRTSPRVVAGIIAGKIVHLSLFLGLPLAVMQRPAWQILVGYAVMWFCAGVTLAIVFQLAHVVEGVSFRSLPADGVITVPWAEHELATTADFGGSRVTSFITGGLDHQVEHHLFPRICHIHYPALARIVASCARDHRLAYHHSGSFLHAVASHARVLRSLGRDEVATDVPVVVAPLGAPQQPRRARRAAAR